MRAEKLREKEEKRKEAELLKQQELEEEKAHERSKEIGMALIKYRGPIFILILAVFLMFIYLVLKSATGKKREIII